MSALTPKADIVSAFPQPQSEMKLGKRTALARLAHRAKRVPRPAFRVRVGAALARLAAGRARDSRIDKMELRGDKPIALVDAERHRDDADIELARVADKIKL